MDIEKMQSLIDSFSDMVKRLDSELKKNRETIEEFSVTLAEHRKAEDKYDELQEADSSKHIISAAENLCKFLETQTIMLEAARNMANESITLLNHRLWGEEDTFDDGLVKYLENVVEMNCRTLESSSDDITNDIGSVMKSMYEIESAHSNALHMLIEHAKGEDKQEK